MLRFIMFFTLFECSNMEELKEFASAAAMGHCGAGDFLFSQADMGCRNGWDDF